MTDLRVVGLFRDLEQQWLGSKIDLIFLPRLRDECNRISLDMSRRIVAHISESIVCIDTLTTLEDPISKRPIIGGLGIETDGVWVWRSYLGLLVREHRPRLDADFIRHVAAPKPPSRLVLDEALLEDALAALRRAFKPQG